MKFTLSLLLLIALSISGTYSLSVERDLVQIKQNLIEFLKSLENKDFTAKWTDFYFEKGSNYLMSVKVNEFYKKDKDQAILSEMISNMEKYTQVTQKEYKLDGRNIVYVKSGEVKGIDVDEDERYESCYASRAINPATMIQSKWTSIIELVQSSQVRIVEPNLPQDPIYLIESQESNKNLTFNLFNNKYLFWYEEYDYDQYIRSSKMEFDFESPINELVFELPAKCEAFAYN